ncbi:MAG: glutathione S-transferase N-terminal domain-containing protein [Thermoleophilaceae bacterium]|nr:glutathione S-transferase N-terminal domain-containing protein [Thermoleophilaceae bacterium]
MTNAAMDVRIYVIPGSHPCEAVMAAARHKGIAFKKVIVLPVMHKFQMKLMFGKSTVPAMKADGQKVSGSINILRTLEALQPEPTIFPSDPQQLETVMRAATWSDGDLQDMGRRLVWSQLSREPSELFNFSAGEKLPVPKFMAQPMAKPTAMIAAHYNDAGDQNVRTDIAKLPALLDEIDALIATGVIGAAQPNFADFLVLSSVALWLTMEDFRPAIEQRPCGKLAARVFPDYPGHIKSGILPQEWLAPLGDITPVTV